MAWMASSTPWWNALALSVLLAATGGCSDARDPAALRVSSASVDLSAQPSLVVVMEFAPRPEVLEALASGVPLHLEFNLGGRDGANRVAFERHVLELSYQPLARQWQLAQADGGPARLFASRSQLLAAVDQVRLPLRADWRRLWGPREYSLRVRLPQSSLPGPLRLPAWFSRTWRIDSGEVLWTSAA